MAGKGGKTREDEEIGELQAPLVHLPSGSGSGGGPDMTGEMEPGFESCYSDKWYRRWVLFLLFLIATLQTTDRNIPAILLPKISPEFNMTDADAGMLNGAAFVFIYALATIPLARIADMCGRKHLLAGSLIVWSTLTSLSGLSQNTTQLCFLRVGIGLGEAGCTPAAQSLIAVMYGPGERASAMAVQQLGLAAGTAAANLIGGLLIDSLGWRGVFGVMVRPWVLPLRFRYLPPLYCGCCVAPAAAGQRGIIEPRPGASRTTHGHDAMRIKRSGRERLCINRE